MLAGDEKCASPLASTSPNRIAPSRDQAFALQFRSRFLVTGNATKSNCNLIEINYLRKVVKTKTLKPFRM
jgi:hypothetical protein